MNKLEELCRPLIRLICEYYYCARAGAPVNTDSLKWEIQIEMENIRHRCENDPILQRNFQKVEQPLVFFIDYTIKEGNFPFSHAWQPIARSYKELSGDEKFFDQLSDNLDDPDSGECLKIFYLLMGLGFDGCYRNEKDYLEKRMKLCSVRTDIGKDLTKESLFSANPERKVSVCLSASYSSRFWYIFTISLILAAAAFSWNFIQFKKSTSEYWNSFSDAGEKTLKKTLSEQASKMSDKPKKEKPE